MKPSRVIPAPIPVRAPLTRGYEKQRVRLGVTMMGVPGLFTNNTLALSVTPEDYALASRDPAFAVRLADRYGFEFVGGVIMTPETTPTLQERDRQAEELRRAHYAPLNQWEIDRLDRLFGPGEARTHATTAY